MRRSLNEVSGDFRKAACGAGYPIGLAEDIARAGIALIEAGHDGVAAVASILPEAKGRELSETALNGPSLFECVLAGDKSAKLENVDAPALLSGFALAAARLYQCCFQLEFSDGTVLKVLPEGLSGAISPTGEAPGVCVTSLAKAEVDNTKVHSLTMTDGVEVNEALLPLVKRWAMETCVPASEQSRLSGAGAGLNDND